MHTVISPGFSLILLWPETCVNQVKAYVPTPIASAPASSTIVIGLIVHRYHVFDRQMRAGVVVIVGKQGARADALTPSAIEIEPPTFLIRVGLLDRNGQLFR